MQDRVNYVCQFIENIQLKEQIADIVHDAEILKSLSLKTVTANTTHSIPNMKKLLKNLDQKEKQFCIDFSKHLEKY